MRAAVPRGYVVRQLVQVLRSTATAAWYCVSAAAASMKARTAAGTCGAAMGPPTARDRNEDVLRREVAIAVGSDGGTAGAQLEGAQARGAACEAAVVLREA